MRNRVGPPVSGRDFFKRHREIMKIWKAIESGTHILMSAPRRVGKTSILFHLLENSKPNYCCIYIITQSVQSENEFYKRLYIAIVESHKLSSHTIRLSAKTNEFLSSALNRMKSVTAGDVGGIELNQGKEADYKNKFINLIKSLDLGGTKIIIMIDEFAQTIENIRRSEGDEKAVHFLQTVREVRHDDSFNENVLFIYTGSIGLEHIAGSLYASDLISDLNSVKIKPLSKTNAVKFSRNLLENLPFNIEEPFIEYMLEKIEWLIPFYIQLFIQEIDNIYHDNDPREITKKLIDKAFSEMLDHRNHFEHWQKRLRKHFKKVKYKFTEDLLNLTAREKIVRSNEILNLAAKWKVQEDYKEIINALIYDGYINNNDNPEVYRFNSPILRTWWYKNVTN